MCEGQISRLKLEEIMELLSEIRLSYDG